ncbi:M48 family metallopeptidase [Fervidibacillus halotolerans]|uniref:M48 family metallopeptidase n=1 Tax=Fervidibacillus halotolerans TaxID=2980027 RepID=A0A9E8M062_9BACI|nr:M48 family metallopeptidase [Fervidibacillus halotolerans]WAA13028.1 M48 family metallopeptidase [Fervidibacillus halotolerans]
MSKRKITIYLIIGYLIYLGLIYLYLFHWDKGDISPEIAGTSVDPSIFMTETERIQAEQYSSIRHFLFFLQIPYEWIFYFLLLLFGWGKRMEKLAEQTSTFQLIKIGVFSFYFSVLSFIVFYPIRFVSWVYAKNYGISTQSFSYWMKDHLIRFWIDFLLLFLIMTVVIFFIRKKGERWWLYTWFSAVPFVLFFMYIQPVVIDPLYNEFTPLTNKSLEGKILSLAEEAGVDAEHVYEVDMSLKTNALNAYVTGIGGNARIVLWDTVIERLDEEEILFIMAHEIAHYVEKHIYIGIVGYLLLLFIGLFFTAKWMNVVIRKFGKILQIDSLGSLSSFLLIIGMISVLSFSASPLVNAASRYQEMRADRYAIETVKNVDAGISTFQKLAKSSLSQVNPPILVKWFRYGHPTLKERILFVESYRDSYEKQ